MRCLYCRCETEDSISVQHIVPESLGNVEHVLPRGVVCDGCNNYIAREVERPFLESLFVREQRFALAVPNKRGRFPLLPALDLEAQVPVEFARDKASPTISVGVARERDERQWIRDLLKRDRGTFIGPLSFPVADQTTARFVAKVGLEALAARLYGTDGGLQEVVDHPGLDEVRHFVRRGRLGKPWPVSCRQLYSSDRLFKENGEVYELLHEYDLLWTRRSELFVVLAVFGVEYCLNLGGPDLTGYEIWLQEHEQQSPLYSGRNA